MSTYEKWLAVFHRDKGYHPLGDVIFYAGVAEGLRRTSPASVSDAEPIPDLLQKIGQFLLSVQCEHSSSQKTAQRYAGQLAEFIQASSKPVATVVYRGYEPSNVVTWHNAGGLDGLAPGTMLYTRVAATTPPA